MPFVMYCCPECTAPFGALWELHNHCITTGHKG